MLQSADHSSQAHISRDAIILSVDIRGFSKIAERDDARATRIAKSAYLLFSDAARDYGGRVFHKAGDGFLAEFGDAARAVNAAFSFSDAVSYHQRVDVRMGLHAGEVSEQPDGDLLGHGVNIAARLQTKANVNGLLISEAIFQQLDKSFSGRIAKRGRIRLKNIRQATVAYDVLRAEGKRNQAVMRNLFRQYQLPALALLALGLVSFASYTGWSKWTLHVQTNSIAAKYFDAGEGSDPIGLHSEQVRNILTRLAATKSTGTEDVYALIKTGNIEAALAALETSLRVENLQVGEQAEILNQIGALAFRYDPEQSLSAFIRLSALTPQSPNAQYWLARTYSANAQISSAISTFETLLRTDALEPRVEVSAAIELAFAYLRDGQFEKANQLMIDKKPVALALKDPLVEARFNLERAQIWESLDQLDIAEGALLESMDVLGNYGHLSQVARGRAMLGQIYLRRAELDQTNSEAFTRAARKHYEEQLELEIKLDNRPGITRTYSNLATASLMLRDVERAEEEFLESQVLAIELNRYVPQFLNHLGLAQVYDLQGDRQDSCGQVAAAFEVYHREIESHIGPRTQDVIQSLSCPGLDLASLLHKPVDKRPN